MEAILERGYGVLRWWTKEFWVLPPPRSLNASLTGLCRLIGCATMLALTRFGLAGGLAMDGGTAAVQLALLVVLAVSLGNLAKEVAFGICAVVVNRCGHLFSRRGLTIDGRRFRETQYPDGTWIRFETGPTGTMCEWTNKLGICNRIDVGPRADSARPPIAAAGASRPRSDR